MIMDTNLAGAGAHVVRLALWGVHSYPVAIVNIFGAEVSRTDGHVSFSNGDYIVTLQTEGQLKRSRIEKFCGEISYLNRKLDGLSIGKQVDVKIYSLSDHEDEYPGLMLRVVHGIPRRFHGPGEYSEEFKFGRFVNKYRADKKRREESKAHSNKIREDMKNTRSLPK